MEVTLEEAGQLKQKGGAASDARDVEVKSQVRKILSLREIATERRNECAGAAAPVAPIAGSEAGSLWI